MAHLKGVLVVALFAFVISYIVLFIINKIMPIVANDDKQLEGLDTVECGMESYPEFTRTTLIMKFALAGTSDYAQLNFLI